MCACVSFANQIYRPVNPNGKWLLQNYFLATTESTCSLLDFRSSLWIQNFGNYLFVLELVIKTS